VGQAGAGENVQGKQGWVGGRVLTYGTSGCLNLFVHPCTAALQLCYTWTFHTKLWCCRIPHWFLLAVSCCAVLCFQVADPLRHFVDGLLSLPNPIGSVGDKVNVGIFRCALCWCTVCASTPCPPSAVCALRAVQSLHCIAKPDQARAGMFARKVEGRGRKEE
jgi:hypothetical protein